MVYTLWQIPISALVVRRQRQSGAHEQEHAFQSRPKPWRRLGVAVAGRGDCRVENDFCCGSSRSSGNRQRAEAGGRTSVRRCGKANERRGGFMCYGLPEELNPQNVPNIQTPPSPSMSPEDSVRAQLDALIQNDEPWLNHGIQTAYEYAFDAGGMERSRYFGFSKDLYHFDHFLGQIQNAYPELTRGGFTYAIEPLDPDSEGRPRFEVSVGTRDGKSSLLHFTMEQYPYGSKKGCFLTKSLLRAPVGDTG